MTDSDGAKKYNSEVCRLRHEAAAAEILHNKEDSELADKRIEKRLDKCDSKLNALILALLAAVGGILSPVVVSIINKVIGSPIMK